MGKKTSILFLENFPSENSGYQNRAQKWREIVSNREIKILIKTIFLEKVFFDDYLNKNLIYFFIFSVIKRFAQIIQSLNFSTIIVRRELLLYNDYGNLFMEKFLLKIHPDVILDFDDDISASKREPRPVTSLFGKIMRENGNKFNDSLRLYKKFIVASNYLKEKVLRENPSVNPDNILVMPTCVDYDKHEPRCYEHNKEVITFGWIGGNQNQPYLHQIIPFLNELSEEHPIELLVISGKPFVAETKFPVINKKWSLEKEVEYLKKIDIGLMPLPLNDITKGKGGFKLIQYMGLGIVSVASAITINREIVDNGINGFLVEPGEDWHKALNKVINQRSNFPEIGAKARQKIMEKYTFTANKDAYLKFVLGE